MQVDWKCYLILISTFFSDNVLPRRANVSLRVTRSKNSHLHREKNIRSSIVRLSALHTET